MIGTERYFSDRQGPLVGIADITIRELQLTIHDVSLHSKGASRWASPPGRPWIKDGAVVTDADGKNPIQPGARI